MSTKREPLPAFEDRAPPDRYCDLILTGGVTSAVAYPAAIFTLATAYRFHSIGGASSGAGAAALAAAAEYRRRHGSAAGFRLLLERMEEIKQHHGRQTGLAWLFQPHAKLRRLFEALVPMITAPSGQGAGALLSFVFAYWVPLLGGLMLAMVAFAVTTCGWAGCSNSSVGDLVAVTLFGVLGAATLWLAAFCNDLARLVNADYGLCSGLDRLQGAPRLPLTPWLHGLIQEIAGREVDDTPLTFADLAAAPGSPRDTMGALDPAAACGIRLQMFTANITHGRPYLLPQLDAPDRRCTDAAPPLQSELDGHGDPRLYFRPSEMRRLFPPSVVEHMIRTAGRRVPQWPKSAFEEPLHLRVRASWRIRAWVSRGGRLRVLALRQLPWRLRRLALRRLTGWRRRQVPENGDNDLLLLPREELPLVVAARMSVSFPVLFSAVPLWVADAVDAAPGQRIVYRRCLFSDGGLCSNFPIHLFDSPIPAWPTFGLSLSDRLHPVQEQATTTPPWELTGEQRREAIKGAVRLPPVQLHPSPERWSSETPHAGLFARLSAVAGDMLMTAKNWNDKMLARLPGVRERIVQVDLDRGLGGLNIRMSSAQMEYLVELGAEAARRLLDRYARPGVLSGVAEGWREHRWMRFNVLCDCLTRALSGMSASSLAARYATPLDVQIDEAVTAPPLKHVDGSALLAWQAAALQGLFATLRQAERDLSAPAAAPSCTPQPRPDLRVRPPL